MWRSLVVVIAAAAFGANIETAKADTYQQFDVSGTYQLDNYYGPVGIFPFDGFVRLDLTSQTLNVADLSIPGLFVFPESSDFCASIAKPFCAQLVFEGIGQGQWTIGEDQLSGGVGPANPGLCTPTDCPPFPAYFEGTMTPTALTPLPATFSLLFTGLGALGLFDWRRKRKRLSGSAGVA
jgi:hypothetical protein